MELNILKYCLKLDYNMINWNYICANWCLIKSKLDIHIKSRSYYDTLYYVLIWCYWTKLPFRRLMFSFFKVSFNLFSPPLCHWFFRVKHSIMFHNNICLWPTLLRWVFFHCKVFDSFTIRLSPLASVHCPLHQMFL